MQLLPSPTQGPLRLAALILGALLSSAAVDCVAQSVAPYRGALTVTVENDVATGSDNNYTNGIGLSWVSNATNTYDEKSFVRRWGDVWSFLPFVGKDGYRTYVAWSFAQEMHTPDDIKIANPPLDDQPYAGVLYLDNIVYAKGERATSRTCSTLRLLEKYCSVMRLSRCSASARTGADADRRMRLISA